ncbi:MAG: DUF2252 family protein [Chloroflexota bacterium]
MNIVEATQSYESWLGQQLTLLAPDLAQKHNMMAADEFSFMRATFYRWAQSLPIICPDTTTAPIVLAVGDLHVENFGTWRDSEGRLIWGVNDLDEAYPLPYANDLIRLAASAKLAIDANHLSLSFKEACAAILTGYIDFLTSGGKPYVLAEEHDWLRAVALDVLRDPARFWDKLNSLPSVSEPIPSVALAALQQSLPAAPLTLRIVHRLAGLGSLGRQRWAALADWRGGKIARETKPLVSSALWAQHGQGATEIFYERIQGQAVRAVDPFLHQRGGWIVRRLAPDCSRIELGSLKAASDQTRLLRAMGREVANIHLGSREAIAAVQRDAQKRAPEWLYEAARAMAQATRDDWHDWKSTYQA